MRRSIVFGLLSAMVVFFGIGTGMLSVAHADPAFSPAKIKEEKVKNAVIISELKAVGYSNVTISEIGDYEKAEYFLSLLVYNQNDQETLVQIQTTLGNSFTPLFFVRKKLEGGVFEPYEYGNGRPYSRSVLEMFFSKDLADKIVAAAIKALKKDFCIKN